MDLALVALIFVFVTLGVEALNLSLLLWLRKAVGPLKALAAKLGLIPGPRAPAAAPTSQPAPSPGTVVQIQTPKGPRWWDTSTKRFAKAPGTAAPAALEAGPTGSSADQIAAALGIPRAELDGYAQQFLGKDADEVIADFKGQPDVSAPGAPTVGVGEGARAIPRTNPFLQLVQMWLGGGLTREGLAAMAPAILNELRGDGQSAAATGDYW